MASVAKVTVDPVDLEEEIKLREYFAESTRHLYFIAARRIQAWIRGILTRNHFRLLHESAVTIQRHWRGYRARIAVDRYLILRVHQMWQDHYDKMATRIQAFWRGYWIRKTVLDIQKMRRWLNEVYLKNEETVKSMKRFRQEEIEYMQAIMERESMQWILFILFKLHHLLRTKHRAGVITRIDKTRFTFIEEMLKCLEYKQYIRWKKMKSNEKCRDCEIDTKATFLLQGTYYERCEKEIREIEKNLRTGVMPIYRSEPYEEHEKNLRKSNQAHLQVSLHEAREIASLSTIKGKQNGQGKDVCCVREKFESQHCCVTETVLCEKIAKMDCHLNQLRLRCPIHDSLCTT